MPFPSRDRRQGRRNREALPRSLVMWICQRSPTPSAVRTSQEWNRGTAGSRCWRGPEAPVPIG
eukprot:7938144-Alexandrium_andersonii.AAC.1